MRFYLQIIANLCMHISARRRALFPTMHPLAPIEVELSVITASLRFKIGPIMSLVSLVFWEVEKEFSCFLFLRLFV